MATRLVAEWRRRHTVRHVSLNSLWLAADNLVRLGLAFVVGVWVTRHLGPAQVGALGAAVAFCAPFLAVVTLGINGLVVRDLAREPEREGEILGTALRLKLVGAALGGGLGLTVGWTAMRGDPGTLALVAVTLAAAPFQAADVVDLLFQGRGVARIPAWVRMGASVAASGLKIGLLLVDAPLLAFASAATVEMALGAVGFWIVLPRAAQGQSGWRWDAAYARSVLREAWPVGVGAAAVQVQAQFDQVLLERLRSAVDLGYYVAALRLVSLWTFLPMALVTAAAPEIARAWRSDRAAYARRLRDVYRVLLVLGGATALALALGADLLVPFVFGTGFAPSSPLLRSMSVRIVLANLGVARVLFLTNEGLLDHSMWCALGGAVASVGLNLWLIPIWGAQGCIIASIASFTLTTVALDLLHPRARGSVLMIAAALGLRRLPG